MVRPAAYRAARYDRDYRDLRDHENALTRETIYLVQGFTEGRDGLKAEKAIRCKTADGARRTAQQIGDTKAGAVAFSSTGDPELGDFDEDPVILIAIGRVPEEFQR